MRKLIGHEYEVRIEGEEGTLPGWFRAKFLTPWAKKNEWLWEITDPRFSKFDYDEVKIVDEREISNASAQTPKVG